MVDLVPPVESLGHAAPVLGPWFNLPDFTLGKPNNDLSVDLEPLLEWLPPSSGLLSLAIASSSRPKLLSSLRNARGEAAFSEGSLVVLFRLLPEVEERLDQLITTFIESADAISIAGESSVRQRVSAFAVEIANGTTLNEDIWDLEPAISSPGTTAEESARSIGLELAAGKLINPKQDPNEQPVFAMTDLKRPGRYNPPLAAAPNSMPRLLKIGIDADDPKLWCFDHRGRPIDPGAVAAWWTQLTNVFVDIDQLWGPSITTAVDRRIVRVSTPHRSIHLVSPNEGLLTEELDKLAFGNAGDSGVLRSQTDPLNEVTISGNSPQLPVRIAMLPNGRYADQISLWPTGSNSPARDMIRVGVVNLDRHLIGAPYPGDSPESKAGVRPEVLKSTGPVFLNDSEQCSQSILQALDGSGERRLVTSVLDRSFGNLSPTLRPDISAEDFPNQLNDPSVVALQGGGEATGDTVEAQRVLVDLQLPTALAGAWLRCWPQGFDEVVSRHIRLDGGAGIVPGDGRVRVVAELPAGAVSSIARMGLEVMLIARDSLRIYNDVRFDRPTPVPGDSVSVQAASGPFLLCEQSLVVADEQALRNPGIVASGTTVVSLDDPPVLVDPSSLRPDHLSDQTIIGRLDNGVDVALTTPAFRRIPKGASEADLSTEGADIALMDRNSQALLTEPGSPLPGLERLEVVCGKSDGGILNAVLASTPTLSRYHELPSHQLGHPDAPASTEFHGAGARIQGQAARPFIEYLRDRTIRATFDRAIAGTDPPPLLQPESGATISTAMLRTVGPGVEGEPIIAPLISTEAFPFGVDSGAVLDWLDTRIPGGLPTGLTGNIPAVDEVVNVINRRVHTAGFGAQDAMHSLTAAIGRAEDFIYIETPAIDSQTIRGMPDDGPQSLWGRLSERLQENPALHVLMNIPTRLAPGTPRRLEAMRNELFLKLQAHPRIGVFSTGTGQGRSLRLASTSVIIDDAFAMTGTTHLWRRGLTYDSSLAMSLFDDQLVNGRPSEITQFRRRLIANRLSIEESHLPDDPAELLLTVAQLTRRNAGQRLSTETMRLLDLVSTDDDINAWNPDGTLSDTFNIGDWFTSLAVAAQIVNSVDQDLSG